MVAYTDPIENDLGWTVSWLEGRVHRTYPDVYGTCTLYELGQLDTGQLNLKLHLGSESEVARRRHFRIRFRFAGLSL